MFDFGKKLEEIRQQPEHIRMRWAMGLTAVMMVLILVIWVVSVKELFRAQENVPQAPIVSDQFTQLRQSASSLKEAVNEVKGLYTEEDQQPQQNSENTRGSVAGEEDKTNLLVPGASNLSEPVPSGEDAPSLPLE